MLLFMLLPLTAAVFIGAFQPSQPVEVERVIEGTPSVYVFSDKTCGVGSYMGDCEKVLQAVIRCKRWRDEGSGCDTASRWERLTYINGEHEIAVVNYMSGVISWTK